MHATDFLKKNKTLPEIPVLVLYGAERFLKLEVLKMVPGVAEDSTADVALTRVAGKDVEWREVSDELLTVSMFGDQRIVVIEEADEFVSKNRAGLEKYMEQPSRTGLLVLDVKSWPKNTRLAKKTDKIGANVDCGELKGAALCKWLTRTATDDYQKTLDPQTAQLIVQLAGDNLGLVLQELDKLVSLVGDNESITQEDVTRVVGGWRIETTWSMLDAIRDGRIDHALECLDKLILAGDAPQKILGGLTFTFRKFAEATERARHTRDVKGSLKSAGIFPQAIGASEAYLKRIGFAKATRILQQLIEADANMKGGSRVDAKTQLEVLFVQLAN